MKAVVRRRYGSPAVMTIEEVVAPTVGDDQVLVRVAAASVNPLDWHELTGTPWIMRLQSGLRRPKVVGLGSDVAGTVEAVGSSVTHLAVGDAVFGAASGAFAELACGSVRSLVPLPSGVSMVDGAAVAVAGVTALQALRDKGGLRPGQSVLIIGASGGVGTFAVQLAKLMGATVTGSCSTANVELVRSLGADRVVDYCAEDALAAGPFDLIIDNAGAQSVRARRRALAPGGRCVVVGGPKGTVLGPLAPMLRAVALSLFSTRKFVPFMAKINRDDLTVLAGHLADGTVRPVVGHTVRFHDAAEALSRVGTGHTRGKVVVTVTPAAG